MTITLRGASELKYTADGGLAVAWPEGTQAGDTAIVVTATSGGRQPKTRVPSGWKLLRSNSAGEAMYGRLILTPADLAGDLDMNAVICGLVVLSGVKAFGVTSASGGVTIKATSGAMLTFGRLSKSTPALTPPTGRVFASDGVNPKFSSYKVKKKVHWHSRRYNAWLTVPGRSGHASIASNANTLMTVALVADVLPSPDAEAMTPTALAPSDDATVQADADIDFLWSLPTAYAEPLWSLHQVPVRPAPSETWGTVSGGHWASADSTKTESESASTGSQTTSTLVDALPGGTYFWRVRALFAGSIWSAWSDQAAFTVLAPPAVGAVTVVPGLEPEVSWTVSSGAPTYAQITITDAAGVVVYTSGLVHTSDLSWTVPMQEWDNGSAYTATVEVTSSEGMTSAAVPSADFVISWVPPAAPTSLVLTAGTPPQAEVTGMAGAALLRLEWLTSAGQEATGTWPVTGDVMDLALPMLPFDVETDVAAYRSDPTGLLWSDPITATVRSRDAGAYLVDDDMTTWIQVIVAADNGVTETEGVSVTYPLGASAPLVIRSDTAGDAGTVTLACRTQAEKQALRAWLKDRGIFWFRRPPERSVLDSTLADVPATRMSTAAPWSEERISDTAVQQRTIPIPWVERP